MNQIPKETSDKEFERLWDMTKEINENIRYYNEHQTKYRILASQWLIAAMTGIGFLFNADAKLPFSNLVLIILVSLISALGILQLWRIDLVIFQRIIGSFFSAGLKIEEQNSALPQIKTKILNDVPHKNTGQNLFYFYYFIVSLFLLIALLSIIYLPKSQQIRPSLAKNIFIFTSCLLYLGILVFLFRYMWFRSVTKEKL